VATKAQLLETIEKMGKDEEGFLLRAQDPLAPNLVLYWAGAAAARGVSPAKVTEARECAGRMKAWPKKKWPD
jgi:hypothetical protein